MKHYKPLNYQLSQTLCRKKYTHPSASLRHSLNLPLLSIHLWHCQLVLQVRLLHQLGPRDLAMRLQKLGKCGGSDRCFRLACLRSRKVWSWTVLINESETSFVFTLHYSLTFRHRASCILGQAFHYFPENAFDIFNQQICFIIWYLLDRESLI